MKNELKQKAREIDRGFQIKADYILVGLGLFLLSLSIVTVVFGFDKLIAWFFTFFCGFTGIITIWYASFDIKHWKKAVL